MYVLIHSQKRRNSITESAGSPKKRRTRQSGPVGSASPSLSSPSTSTLLDRRELRPSSAITVSSPATPSSLTSKYIDKGDEVVEDEELGDMLGESEPGPRDKKTLPVRILTYFDIYDLRSGERRVLPMDIDPDEDVVSYGASGCVRPQLLHEDEEDDWESDAEEDVSLRVKLGAIQDVWTDKTEIWIQTQHAWYILEYPSETYRRYYNKMKVLAQNYSDPSSSRSPRTSERSAPFITPRVGNIAQGLFLRSLLMLDKHVKMDPELRNVCVPDVPFVVHSTNPTTITWGEKFPGTTGFYKSVFVDGVEYHVLDTVAVAAPSSSEEDDDDNGTLSKSAWFAQICYFFDRVEGKGKRTRADKYFHLRWFSHGSQTILGETANPQALFLLDQCDDNPVEAILQKISVRQLDVGELEPVVISKNDVGSNSFHLSHKWDSDKIIMSTVDFEAERAPTSRNGLAYTEQPTHMRCYSCAIQEQKEVQQACNKLKDGTLEIFGEEYHLHDFVYVQMRPDRQKQHGLLTIAQVVDLLPSSGTPNVKVSIFERAADSSDEQSPRMQRSLLHSGRFEKVSAECLDGHCFVLRMSEIDDLEQWLEGPDNFILLHQKKRLEQCQQCIDAHRIQLKSEALVKAGPPLRAMDLFAGAGGLTTGMDASGYIKTCWAIERSPSAARSLKANHGDIIVYNQDCNAALKHAAELQAGKHPPALRSLDEAEGTLPPLPAPGEVDLVMGGPPCQPFSGMNRFKRIDDIRQTCIPTVLSYVEHYSPQYALIENVTGLLHYRLKGRQEGQRIVGGVEAGMVKFIMRAFTSLGYQCQMRVLNSADYGSPQQRNRVIFWAARLDLALPKWPKPTHIPCNGHNSVIRRIADIGFAPVASRNEFEDGHKFAPFHAVTVKEAISDLPAWDWENPGIIYPKGANGPKKTKETFSAEAALWRANLENAQEVSGYNYPVRYASAPKTLYQAGCRKGQSEHARVEYHYTELYSSGVVERTVNVPIRPLANFKDLPKPLQEDKWRISPKKGQSVKFDTYWRLDENGQFRTLMTLINPSSKGAYVIHPTDKRVLSVRELARAQGFPDYYEFCSVEERSSLQVKDMERQIGNAVPVHLAYALGRALGEGLVQAEINRRLDQEDAASAVAWDAWSHTSEEI